MPRPGAPDHYRRRARTEGYVARAIYKLKAIDEKYHLFSPGSRVLDLGCSPGSWLQYIGPRVSPGGLVVGVDVVPPAIPVALPLDFLQGEVESLDLAALQAIVPHFDVVVSDLAPRTTGVKEVDQARSVALARRAWEIAQALLRPGGHFLVKVFEGPDTPALVATLRQAFGQCHRLKPAGSRPESREFYLLALRKKAAPGQGRRGEGPGRS
jgi:23S rRNA (uridine2552-2'-O)-methyltransferase